jgi:hypothetical protein
VMHIPSFRHFPFQLHISNPTLRLQLVQRLVLKTTLTPTPASAPPITQLPMNILLLHRRLGRILSLPRLVSLTTLVILRSVTEQSVASLVPLLVGQGDDDEEPVENVRDDGAEGGRVVPS